MTDAPLSDPAPAPASAPRRRVVLITGMSGAGLSTSLKALEDVGYEAVDNLRLRLVPTLIENASSDKPGRPLAIAIDSRNVDFSVESLLQLRQTLGADASLEVTLLFLDCSDDALQQRFTATRRRHPLAMDRSLSEGIGGERAMLKQARDFADHVLDTSAMSIHDLRRIVIETYRHDKAPGLTLFVLSFSYSHGVPREADLVFDARFLKNPHYDLRLRPMTGQDPEVAAYIQSDPDYPTFMTNLSALVLPLLPRFQAEGKSYLTIAIGCTGGRHRSVLVAEELATDLATHGHIVTIKHRELVRLDDTDAPPRSGS